MRIPRGLSAATTMTVPTASCALPRATACTVSSGRIVTTRRAQAFPTGIRHSSVAAGSPLCSVKCFLRLEVFVGKICAMLSRRSLSRVAACVTRRISRHVTCTGCGRKAGAISHVTVCHAFRSNRVGRSLLQAPEASAVEYAYCYRASPAAHLPFGCVSSMHWASRSLAPGVASPAYHRRPRLGAGACVWVPPRVRIHPAGRRDDHRRSASAAYTFPRITGVSLRSRDLSRPPTVLTMPDISRLESLVQVAREEHARRVRTKCRTRGHVVREN